MAAGTSDQELLGWLDARPLSKRYGQVVTGLGLIAALDYFDFYVVGFLMAFLSPSWGLTYGQSGIILLSAGLGSIIGAIIFGGLADRFGRKAPMLFGSVLCGICSAGIAIIPDGAWQLFATLRFGVGLGLAATVTATMALIVEHTPTRHRTLIGSLVVVFTSGGPLIASLTMATLMESIGWRGIAGLGALPAFVALAVIFIVPESTRWLVSRGQIAKARLSAGRMAGCPIAVVPETAIAPRRQPATRLSAVCAYPRAFWLTVLIWLGASTANYGIYLWGPTILAIQLDLNVGQAAGYFTYVALAGIAGKVLFSVLPQRFGRVPAGLISGYGLALVMASIAFWHDASVYGVPVFLILLISGALFFDGIFANQAPYAAEVFPVSLAARGVGLGQAANGVGKILGPLSLALLAGTDNFVAPQATADAMLPGFLFLAAMALMIGLAFTFLGIETHRKPLRIAADEPQTTTQQTKLQQS